MLQHEIRERITYVYGGPPVSFGPSNATAELYVDDSYIIDSVRVEIDIQHTYDRDVTAILIAPDETQVVLVSNVGGSSDNFTHTVFSDAAGTSISAGTAPFTGTYRPAQPLSTLHDHTTQGVWQLRLQDSFPSSGDGTLSDWFLTIVPVQGGYVQGRVVALATQQPLIGARIETTTGQFTLADSGGNYSLFVNVGTAHLRALLTGWCPTPIVNVEVTDGDTVATPFALRRARNCPWDCYHSMRSWPSMDRERDTLRVENTGDCDLIYSLVETVSWIDATYLSDTLAPAAVRAYAVGYHAVGLTYGDHQATITVQFNGLGTPYLLPVYLYVAPPSTAGNSSGPVCPRNTGCLATIRTRLTAKPAFCTRCRRRPPFMWDSIPARAAIGGVSRGLADGGLSQRAVGRRASASGVYLVRLTAEEFSATHRLLLTR